MEELSEHEKWEAVKAWIRENGLSIVAGVAVGVAGILGWNWWQDRQERLALEASAKYEQVLEAFQRGDRTRGQMLIDELARDYPSSPYVDQANLLAASAAVQANDLSKAAERLQIVVNESDDRELALIARLRLARVQIAQGRLDEALATLGTEDRGAFASPFHEVRGDVYYEKGDREAALKEYRAAREKALSPEGSAVLELKINDLLADASASPQAAGSGAGATNP